MALFQVSVLKNYLKLQDDKIIDKAYKKFTSYFQHPEIQENIRKSKEEQFQATFLNELFVNILGYILNPHPEYNLTTEFKNESNNRKADGAILNNGNAVGVIELKGTNTKHLEGIRKQAFDYKANQKNCVYVITSNFEKLRFYINDATEFLEFDLFELNRDEFGLLWLCLHKDNIFSNLPVKIKEASIVEEESITKEFYNDYSVFKRELYRDLVKKNAKKLKSIRHSELVSESLDDEVFQKEIERLEKNVKLSLFKKSQKLIDRFLFVFFAEDRGLLPPNSIVKIVKQWDMLKDMDVDQSLYERYKIYFNYLNTGREAKGDHAAIFAYNGGLFKPDQILDMLEIDNDLLHRHTKKLASYDFESQVDVNILGHIFENSLNEIESVNAEIEGADFDKQKSKRKKDGVFYTPKYITKYIVENTIGKLCEEKKTALGFREEEYFKGRKKRHKATLEQLLKILDDYREWLLQLTICDPACGSGAFLNQALDFLIKEHRYIDEMRGKLLGESFRFPGIENTVLENNIYGVDINEESVEIAKLSLWLRTARPHRKLNDLSDNIKCGNSLINDQKVAGDKAFVWEKEFREVFAKGGFDVIIGNPPYLGIEGISENLKKFFVKIYETAKGRFDLYTLFIEKAMLLKRKEGSFAFIIPGKILNNTQFTKARRIVTHHHNVEVLTIKDRVFVDAQVNSVILINSYNPNFEDAYYQSYSLTSSTISFRSKTKVINLLNDKYCIFKLDVNQNVDDLLRKIELNSSRVDEIAEVKDGVINGMVKDILVVPKQKNKYCKPLYYGKNIKKYHIGESDVFIDYRPEIMMAEELIRKKGKAPGLRMRTPEIFEREKILTRFVGKEIIAAYDDKKLYYEHTLHSTHITKSNINHKYLLTLYNSRLINFYYQKNNSKGGNIFPQVRISSVNSLPIKLVNQKTQNKFISSANLMQISTKEYYLVIERFVQYFNSIYGLVKLSKKLQNWHELEFGEFIKELNKAIKKTNREREKEGLEPEAALTKKDEFEWMELFEENKEKAVDLQQKIDETDRKIDQMVYELYGLTDEEIAIVEAS